LVVEKYVGWANSQGGTSQDAMCQWLGLVFVYILQRNSDAVSLVLVEGGYSH
jgi:hypothetical protein